MTAQKKLWPRFALSPTGQRAKFDCPGDVMTGWVLEVPLPEPMKETLDGDPDWAAINATVNADLVDAAKIMKRGPGRPRKVVEE